MGSIKQFEEILEFALPSFLKTIEKEKIKERILCDQRQKIEKIRTGTYRYLEGEHLFPSSFWIYGNKVALFIWNSPYFVILIKNKEVSNSYRSYFEILWKITKR